MTTSIYTRTQNFLSKAKLKHNDKYDYSLVDYKNSRIKVKIICHIHGMFEQLPSNHLSGYGCSKCANNIKLTTQEYINKAKLIHGDLYDYSLVNYITKRIKVKIICPLHGIFEQLSNDHLTTTGCKTCANERLTGVYNSTILNRDPELANKPSTLYLIKHENLYKIGITTKSIQSRFNKDVNIISQLDNIKLINSFIKEQEILSKYSQFKEKPENWEHGGINEFLNITTEQRNKIIVDYFI